MKKDQSLLMALLILSAVLFLAPGTMAEEILVTKDGIHMGWVVSKDRFMTCRKMTIEIGEGSVEEIIDRCPTLEKVPPVKGLIESIDTPNQILSIRIEGGQIQELFYFEPTGGYAKTRLKDLEKGDQITITIPVPGRLGSIRTEKKQDAKRLF